ncbi:MAG TPA: hypothetical protein VK427_05405 [Kofleriaceae bacterium]|nr:hypothetical protein [Kofleriaceae bacterium]
MRCLPFLVGAFSIGCAGARATRVEPPSAATREARIAWLRSEVARATVVDHQLRGAYLPKATPGAAIVCSLAIEIDAWYGVGADKWELTNASVPALREELARIGIRDCVLDINR